MIVTMAPARNLDESDASMRARLVESLSQSFPGSALSKALHGIMGDYDSANAAVADDSDCSDVLSSSCFAELRLDKVKMEELEADAAEEEDDELTSLAWLQDADLLKNIHTEGIYDDVEDGQKENEFGGHHGHAHPPHVPYNPQKHINSKPPYSFSCLIFMAIEDCPTKRLPVKDIYNWMVAHFPYFANAPTGWKNSVRHNLSLNKCFKKVDKDKGSSIGKGSLWMIDPDYRPNLLQALRKTPYHPYHQLQMLSATSPTTNFTMLPSGARLFPWTNQPGSLNSPSPHLFPFLSKRLAQSKFETESDIDVANTLMSLKRGLESRPALKCQNGWPRSRSPSPPEFGSEQDKHLLREKHRARASIVCTAPPSDDHNYGVTEGQLRDMQDSPNSSIDGEYDFGRWGRSPSELDEDTCSDCSGFDDEEDDDVDEGCRDDRRLCVKLPHHSPIGKRKLSRSPVSSVKKMRMCVKVEDEAEKLKIVEGADALLNLAGITREPSMTCIVPLRSISPISPTSNDKTNNNNNEVKSET